MSVKERSLFYATGGVVTGSLGTQLNDLLYGSACINCPSAVADSTVVSASLAVANVSAGDNLFVQVHTNAPSAMVLLSACAITGGISASWHNTAASDNSASADVTVSYLVFK